MDVRTAIDKAGGRKLVIGLLLIILATVMLFMQIGGINFQQWGDFVKWVFGLLAVSNVASKVATKNNGVQS